ncbi:polysaccharide biosynthesis/export family protein [Parasphingorhabdus sp. DH2-15]|uniref:polysaccharide biosynthesis/export family protein n=1 Tax=Parasphingorhabdus sp. DH2-15 TaxID=3444112 RepID=UPI003F6884F5
MKKIIQLALIASASTLVVGCQAKRSIVAGAVPADDSALASSSSPDDNPYIDYLIGPEDVLAINVFREPDLSAAAIRVDSGGRLQMPLIGRVDAVNKTADQLSQEIEQRLGAKYLVNPDVAVNLVEGNSRRITVEGEVESPGVFPTNINTNLLSALALAGGPEDTAALDQIAVFRKVNGQNMVAVFNLADIRAGLSANPEIKPGDIIVVGFSKLRKGLEQVIGVAPIFNVFNVLTR